MNVAIVAATVAARASTLHKAKLPLMGVSSFATDNHCLEIATGQLHGSRHSAILMDLRDTIQSDAAMDHIMPRRECLR
ncbi:unnamed protein product [Prunus armeniaca]|uniref:Uncharacterized protein n=1 Tax=Prunus armeniaca TaxID=36596 RepID=A0A6J5W4Q4_PRUAR|nr:unnamed protein product [Prunus armeniaca]